MDSLGVSKVSTSKKLLAAAIIVACLCVPFMQSLVFTAEEAQAPKKLTLDPIFTKPSRNGHVSDDSLHPVAAPRPAAEDAFQEIAIEKPVFSLPVDGETENPATNVAPREKSLQELRANEIVAKNPLQVAPVPLEPLQQKPVGNKRIDSSPPNKSMPSDLTAAVRRQKIFAVRTPKTRFACCVPPKNGCTYHFGLLHRIVGIQDYERPLVVHDDDLIANLNMERFSHEEIRDFLESDSIPKYIIVRNPIIRTLSAYLNRVEPELSPMQKVDVFENWIMQQFPEGKVMEASASPQKRLKMNPHWMPQTEFCGVKSDLHRKFRVFRFEEPEKYLNYMYEFVPREFLDDGWRGKDNVSLKEFMLGPKKRTAGTTDKVAKYFRSVKVFDHLARELRGDIEAFGYQKDVASLRKKVILNQRNPSN